MNFIKRNELILAILLFGVIFRLLITANDSFIFNMDNARDMVDVREMVVLHHPRLIGQTTSIDGVFYGPAWYYILAIPFVLTGGNPYGSIILEILLWAFGGYFLLFLVRKFYGLIAMFVVGLIWLASNFILLGTQYAFNPNPILFLTPVFIFSLWKYLETEEIKYSVISFFLAGLFLHFEVTTGLFMVPIIILAVLFNKKWQFLKHKSFYFGVLAFFITLSPQIFFELRHNFFMTKSLLAYHSGSHGEVDNSLVPRFNSLLQSYQDTLLPTFMNITWFTRLFIIGLIGSFIYSLKYRKNFDQVTTIGLLLILVPLIGLIPLKVDIMRWYLNGAMIGSIFLIGWVIRTVRKIKVVGILAAIGILILVTIFSVGNMHDYILAAEQGDPGNSIFKNEVAAVDYTYQQSGGKNFKEYTYLPSVLDWPYQYIYWWYGLKKYGYTPSEYAYAPNKPQYINQKELLNKGSNPPDSGLTFLIKEQDRPDLLDLWENNFKNLQLINTTQIGSIIVETRR